MIATIEGEVRGYKVVKTQKGELYVYGVLIKDRQGSDYMVNVVSLKNGLKNGQQSLKVNIRNRFDKENKVMKGFKLWTVDELPKK